MRYDYIFSGMGLSTMMILYKMIQAERCSGKSILVIEPQKERHNDRTWCFWEKGSGDWDFLLKKSWKEAYFLTEEMWVNCLGPSYEYKMIESGTFYEFILKEIKQCEAIRIVHDKVIDFKEGLDFVSIITERNQYETEFFFNSVLDHIAIQNNNSYPLLQQHFMGWFIQTEFPFFDEERVTFMDFSVFQKGNTRFMYVLPVAANKILVEYTLFSSDLLAVEEYETEIENYLKSKGITDFRIVAKEKGIIPMTSYPFWNKNTKRVLHIGSAGGWTKASTGYTFKNSEKLSNEVVDLLKKDIIDFTYFKKANRFTFYDRLFVKVLYDENALGKLLFSRMFSKVKPDVILRFLDEESSFIEELKVIWACPKWPFVKALFKK